MSVVRTEFRKGSGECCKGVSLGRGQVSVVRSEFRKGSGECCKE